MYMCVCYYSEESIDNVDVNLVQYTQKARIQLCGHSSLSGEITDAQNQTLSRMHADSASYTGLTAMK